MTNNPTIDGVSRELLELAMLELTDSWSWAPELRALLDAAHTGDANGMVAPAVERQEHKAEYFEVVAEMRQQSLTRAWGKIRTLRDDNKQLQARIAELESGSKPVLIQAVAVTRDDEDEGLRLEWLLEGGISELEFAGQVLFAMPEANGLCDENGSAEVYAAPPAPAAALSEAMKDLRKGLTTLETGCGKYCIVTSFQDRDDAWDSYMSLTACLDATAALNTPK